MGPVQTLPAGLLGLLGVKNAGQNPNILPDIVQPTLELLTMYALSLSQRKQETIAKPGGAGAITKSTGALVVPAGKYWYVWEMHVGVGALGVAPPLDIAVWSLDQQNNVSWVRNISPPGGRPIANQAYSLGLSGMWCRPGDILAVVDTGAGITAYNVALTMNIAEIQG